MNRLVEALKSKNMKTAERLLDQVAHQNTQDEDGMTLLHWVAGNGYQPAVECLVEQSDNVNSQDSAHGGTPLHRAVENGHQITVEYLIKHNADVNIQDNYGRTPLHYAVINSHQPIVIYLVEAGSDVNVPDNEGETPLRWATVVNSLTTVDYLIAHGASLNACDKESQTPLHLAISLKYITMTQLFLAQGAYCSGDSKVERTLTSWIYRWKAKGCINEEEFLCGIAILLTGFPISHNELPERLQRAKARIETLVKQYLSPLELSKKNILELLQSLPKLILYAEQLKHREEQTLHAFCNESLTQKLKLAFQGKLDNTKVLNQTDFHLDKILWYDCRERLDVYKVLQNQLWQQDWEKANPNPSLKAT